MKKKFVLLLILMTFLSFVYFLIYQGPANPKLHTIGTCEKIVFNEGKNKNDTIKLFGNSVEIKKECEINDVLILFIDKDRYAIAYPLYTYFDDLEREPFYDGIDFEVPF